ncbi:MAG: endonuclease NucS [Anaerolineaceae bacterium]|nr:endonuclease NucS [Anaerolineaceae bacterium]
MSRFGLWQIVGQGPKKLPECNIDIEKNLESWIEADPRLVQGGLEIIGRQLSMEGGRLDLLALDPQGRWAIIEIKAGAITADAISQAIYYAAYIGTSRHGDLQRQVDGYLKPKGKSLHELLRQRGVEEDNNSTQRETVIFLVGAGRTPGLDRTVQFLTQRYEMPISVISFDMFELETGERILTRELTELDTDHGNAFSEPVKYQTIDAICHMADQHGVGAEVHALVEGALKHGLYPRPYARSIMFTPPNNHTRMLFTVRADPKPGKPLWMYIEPEVFTEFFPVSEEAALGALGVSGWREMTANQVEAFVNGLDGLFEGVVKQTKVGTT